MHFVCNLALPTHYKVNSHGNSNSESSVHHFDLNAGLMEIQKKNAKTFPVFYHMVIFSTKPRMAWVSSARRSQANFKARLDFLTAFS